MDGQMNIYDFPEYLPKQEEPFYKQNFCFIPYIVDELLNNSLLEPFTSRLIEELKKGADDMPSIFNKSIFKLTSTQHFKCKGTYFSIVKSSDFKANGICNIHHCGSDNDLILADILVNDIAIEIMERIKNVEKIDQVVNRF